MNQRRCVEILALVFVFGSLIGIQVNADVDEGLVEYFRFEESSGKEILDSSGLEHNGEAIGDVDWVEGKFGKGVQFDGKASHAKVPAGTLGMFEEATMALWAKMLKMPSTNSYNIVGMTSGPGAGFYLELYGGTLAAWQCGPNLNASVAYTAVGEWHHLVTVYTGADILIYIDGVQKAKAAGTNLPDVSNMPLLISGDHAEAVNFGGSINGIVDEVRIYNRALKADEMEGIMEESKDKSAVIPADKLSITWAEVKNG